MDQNIFVFLSEIFVYLGIFEKTVLKKRKIKKREILKQEKQEKNLKNKKIVVMFELLGTI